MSQTVCQTVPQTVPEKRHSFHLIALALILILIHPQEALAWGPMTHVAIGGKVLDALALLPAGAAAILLNNRRHYLYGCIAADVVFAKRLSRVKQFCHHWSTGFGLLDEAETDEERAFAYGYMSHLAADTVAHGKFVPRQVSLSSLNVNFGHLYWELRADAMMANDFQKPLKQLLNEDNSRFHQLMARHLRQTFLPYELNRVLFHRMNTFAAKNTFVERMERLQRSVGGRLSDKLLQRYIDECVDRTLSLIIEGRQSPILRDDPNGTSALMQLTVYKRELSQMRRKGLSVLRRLRETSRNLAPEGDSLVPLK
ncbi:MAG: zinc dependent phospholipase C family protein [Phycisphaerae bacterium]